MLWRTLRQANSILRLQINWTSPSYVSEVPSYLGITAELNGDVKSVEASVLL
jgi:hypothetical protein